MKVNGQLENAQLEQIAAPTTTPTSTARMYADVTNPLAAVPMFFNGTTWRSLKQGQSEALISQNSGIACTVDWSLGLNQEVVLTAGCTISFQNPQAGEVHTLVVKQSGYSVSGGPTTYMHKLNMVDQDCQMTPYQTNWVLAPNSNKTYRWIYKQNVKLGYSSFSAQQSVPPTNPATLVTGIAISPDGKVVQVGRTSTPFTGSYILHDPKFYPSPGGQMLSSGVLTTGTAGIGQPTDIAYHPSGLYFFLSSLASPYIQGSTLNAATGPSVVSQGNFSSPGIGVTGAGRCIAVHPTGYVVACGHTTSPFISAYPFTPSGFGTKLTNPAVLPAAAVTGVDFAPTGDYIATACQTFPYIEAWVFDATTGPANAAFGAKSANPVNAAPGGPAGSLGKAIKWRPQGDYIAMAMSVAPYLYVVPFDRTTGSFGTNVTVTSVPSGAVNCVDWTPDGQYLLLGLTGAPYLIAYDFSAGTLVSTVPFDGSSPGQPVNGISIDPTGSYCLLGLGGGTFLTGYNLPSKARNYLKLVDA